MAERARERLAFLDNCLGVIAAGVLLVDILEVIVVSGLAVRGLFVLELVGGDGKSILSVTLMAALAVLSDMG